MKTFLKENWITLIALLIILILLVMYFCFILDAGFRKDYFIKRDFNKAFSARMSGNCSLFKDYVSEKYREDWGRRCVKEKDGKLPQIKSFNIKNVSVNDEVAFLQVEVERNIDAIARLTFEKEGIKDFEAKNLFNYDMQKINFDKLLYILPKTKWIILNEIQENNQ